MIKLNSNEKDIHNQQKKSEVESSHELVLENGITLEAQEIMNKLGLKDPGANGDPVILSENISEDIKIKVNASFEENKLNAFVSDMISLNRMLPDLRSEACRMKLYSTTLPKCSIIISFHNENRLTLKLYCKN